MKRFMLHMLGSLALAALAGTAGAAPEYVGVKVCTKCHEAQGDSWANTAHAKTFAVLKPGAKTELKPLIVSSPQSEQISVEDVPGNAGCEAKGQRTQNRSQICSHFFSVLRV